MIRSAFTAFLLIAAVGCEAPSPEPTETADWSPLIQSANEALLNQGQVERIDEFFAASYGGGEGREEIRDFITDLRTSFPDLQVEVETLVQEGNRIAWLRRHRGTHEVAFRGVPASGRELTWRSMVVSRIEGGLILEEWSVSNLDGVLRTQ